ncbi:hypothetical protein ACFL9U_11895 [Thermodesulfobacteriota bacterium]
MREVASKVTRDTNPTKGICLKLLKESDHILEFSRKGVICRKPDGKAESVNWNDLKQFDVITGITDPETRRLYWVLHGTLNGCVIPQGAIGEDRLLERLQKLPNFDGTRFTEAMSCAENRTFVCWKKSND